MRSGFGAESAPVDLRLRVEALHRRGDGASGVDRDGVHRVRQAAGELHARLARNAARGSGDADRRDRDATSDDVHDTGALLALAFPDRVAKRREGALPRYLLRNGAGAALARHDALADAEWLAVAELDGAAPEYRIARAAPLSLQDVLADFDAQITREERIEWHEGSRSVRGVRRRMLGALTIDEAALAELPEEAVRAALLQEVARGGVEALPWSSGAGAIRARLAFLHHHDASWPDVSDVALTATLQDWLGPHVSGMRKWSDLTRVDWTSAMLSLLPWDRRASLDRLAPSHIEVPSGSRIALDYSDPASPTLAVKLQETFGGTATPRLFDERVPVTMQLLSPAGRPVQVTRDLAGFWRTSYFEVRKELRGRYPRHPWPEDPMNAVPTRRVKPRGT